MFLCLTLIYAFISLWPPDLADAVKGSASTRIVWLGTRLGIETSVDARLLLLVVVMGALGSFVHTATSFGDFVGNQKFSRSWVWWYVLRPFIGMALAAVVYVAVRAGFLSGGGTPNTLNLYGVTALSGMVGMFSKQATDKLAEVFETLFRTAPGGGDFQRRDSLERAQGPRPATPALSRTRSPGSLPEGTDASANDHDACSLGLFAPTPDEALPAARGGVGS